MNCQQCRAAMLAYLDDSLPPRQRATVEAHLATCADCRAMLAQWRAIGAATEHAHARLVPPAGAPQRGWDQIARQMGSDYTSPAKGSPMTFDSSAPTIPPGPHTSSARRRGIIPIAAVLLAVIVVVTLVAWRSRIVPSTTLGRSIIMFTLIPSGANDNSSISVISAIDSATGKLQWRRQLPDGLYPIPKNLGDRIIVTTAENALTFKVMALKVSNGAMLWQQSISGLTQVFAVTPQTTYVSTIPSGGNDTQVGKRFVAIDNDTGKVRWDVAVLLDSPALASLYVPDAIYPMNNTVVVEGSLALTGYSAFLMGLDAATGEKRWLTTIPNTLSGTTIANTSGTAPDDAVIIGNIITLSYPSTILGFDATTGHLRWTFPHGGTISSDGSTLFISDDGSCPACKLGPKITNTLYAVRPADGRVIWQHPWALQSGTAFATVDIGNGVLLGSDVIARRISAFDAASGRVLWERAGVFATYRAFGNDAFLLNTPAPVTLTAPQVASTLSALDLRSGTVHWQHDFNGTTQPIPTQLLVNKGLVIGVSTFQTTSLYAYRSSDGKQLWQFTSNEGIIRILPDPS